MFVAACDLGSKFWIEPDEADVFLVNTHLKCSPGTRMEPLAQTWYVEMWRWNVKSPLNVKQFHSHITSHQGGLEDLNL